jgi:hypothetical protein
MKPASVLLRKRVCDCRGKVLTVGDYVVTNSKLVTIIEIRTINNTLMCRTLKQEKRVVVFLSANRVKKVEPEDMI